MLRSQALVVFALVAACSANSTTTEPKQPPASDRVAHGAGSGSSAIVAALPDAGVLEPLVPAAPLPPPTLACADATTAVRAPAPDPTWACVRADGMRDGPFATLFPDGSVEIAGSYAANLLDGAWSRHAPGGALVETGSYKAGLPDGHWRQLEPDGHVIAEYDLVAGTGTVTRWFADGSRRELKLKAGVPTGPSTTYAPDGTVLVKETFRKGKPYGDRSAGNRHSIQVTLKDDNRQISRFGILMLDEHYDRNGRLDGKYTVWRDKTVPRITGSYDHGHRDGLWTWTDRDDNKEREGTYVKGERDGVWTEWTENQPTLVGNYVSGRPDGTWIYTDKSGVELGRFDFVDGTGVAMTFWPNKKVSSKSTLYKGSQDGPYQELNQRGKLVLEGHFDGDRKSGWWKQWTELGVETAEAHWRRGKLDGADKKLVDGQPTMTASYKDGRAIGAYSELRDGKPWITGQFVDDRRDGTWTAYAADGSVRLTSTYKAGVLVGPWHEVVAGITTDGQLAAGRRVGTWTRTDRAGVVTTLAYPAN